MTIEEKIIISLFKYLEVAHLVFEGIYEKYSSEGIATDYLLRSSNIPHVRQSEALAVLSFLNNYRVINKKKDSLELVYTRDEILKLAYMAYGADLYKGLSDDVLDKERPEIVLTESNQNK